MTFEQSPISCPECSATGGLQTLSCSQYAHEPTRRLTEADLATLKGLVPWQWENWLDPYERGMPLCDVTQLDLQAMLDEIEECRRSRREVQGRGR